MENNGIYANNFFCAIQLVVILIRRIVINLNLNSPK